MKKFVLLICMLSSLLPCIVVADEIVNPSVSARQPPPPLPIPTRDHSEFPIINSLQSNKPGIAPTIQNVRPKPHMIKPAINTVRSINQPVKQDSAPTIQYIQPKPHMVKPTLNVEQPINPPAKQIKVYAVPHNENHATNVLNVQHQQQPHTIKTEMTIQSHKITLESKPQTLAVEASPSAGPIQELHYNQTKLQKSNTGIIHNYPIRTNSTIHAVPRVKHQPKQLRQINPRAQPPNNPPTQQVVSPHKQGIPVLAPKNMDTK